MALNPTYEDAAALEQYLGDPFNPENILSFQRMVELDDTDTYPADACTLLEQWQLGSYFVPEELGGRLKNFEQLLSLWRLLARRDLTVTIALCVDFLVAIQLWLAGTPEQKQKIIPLLMQTKRLAIALTEKQHGADLLASDMQALKVEGGYLLSGEKWLINNATLSSALTVFARTNPRSGPRDFSWFWVEKDQLDVQTFSHLPKIKTHGIRGADISGICFDKAFVPDTTVIGMAGGGLELGINGLMISRMLCSGLSLGAADSALRITLQFATQRRLYNGTIIDIPQVKKTLLNAFTDILLAEMVALSTVRGIHECPDQLSVWSAVTKYFVPTLVEQIFRDLSVVLGARHYLREEHCGGAFQKFMRDNALVSLFDGSTIINLDALGSQLKQLALYNQRPLDSNETLTARLRNIFDLNAPLTSFKPEAISLLNRGRNDMLQGLACISDLDSTLNPEAADIIQRLIQKIQAQVAKHQQAVLNLDNFLGSPYHHPPALFDLAREYCWLHSAATAIQFWMYNRTQPGWLILCLNRVLEHFQQDEPIPETYAQPVFQQMITNYEHNQLFSLLQIPLAN